MIDLPLILGVFLGNWLLLPLATDFTFKDSFFVGILAGFITFMLIKIFL